ncbi:MAG: zinc ribbon domain-containing protein [Methanobacteriota archaeon]|nr:MAG: zinc ribbon domain-containing protein [Euryarchaeota archaeon]
MADKSLPVFVLACVECGKTVSGNEEKCPRCGISFEGLGFECPFCGGHVSTNQRRCESCGTEFEVFASEVAEASAISLDSGTSISTPEPKDSLEYECPACGKSVGEVDDKCPHCGANFT